MSKPFIKVNEWELNKYTRRRNVMSVVSVRAPPAGQTSEDTQRICLLSNHSWADGDCGYTGGGHNNRNTVTLMQMMTVCNMLELHETHHVIILWRCQRCWFSSVLFLEAGVCCCVQSLSVNVAEDLLWSLLTGFLCLDQHVDSCLVCSSHILSLCLTLMQKLFRQQLSDTVLLSIQQH